MVRQAYGHRLALGRSAFELPIWPGDRPLDDPNSTNDELSSSELSSQPYVQRFNSRGHPLNPESRTQIRRNVRAHNEVLSTVDVCARVDSEGKDIGKRKDASKSVSERKQGLAIVQENETGLWLGVIDDLACLVATTFTANLRRRIETFNFYGGFPILRIACVETSAFGFWKFFFAGEFANTAFYILSTTLDAFIEIGHDYLVDRLITKNPPDREQRVLKYTIDFLEQGLKLTSFFLLSPLQLFATLQRLDLLPAWPLLPNPLRWSYLTPVLTPFPSQWDGASLRAFTISLATSPFVTFLYMFYFTDKIKAKLCNYSRATIPRPDNPDYVSFKLDVHDGTTGTAPVLDYPKFQGSLRQELRKDMQGVLDRFTDIRHQVRSSFRWLFKNRRPSVSFPPEGSENVRIPPNHNDPQEQSGSDFLTLEDAGDTATVQAASPPTVQPESSTETSTSPLLTPTSSEDPDVQAEEASNVRIRTRTGSTSTLHMDVEFNAPERGAPVMTSSFSASPRPILETIISHSGHKSYHRVTALSLHASDSLGSHIVGAFTSLLRLPLESLYVRSLATRFLGTNADGSHSWILASIHPLNHWILPSYRGVGWPGFLDYVGKILLCVGTETVITTRVWRLGCSFAEKAGRSWYSWGKL